MELDGGREITLDAGYLQRGHLDHAYALTAHKAQGATVDRTFVLGSEDLYRELGYTALSRHRDEARFYVARGDLTTIDRDLPTPDPVIAGLQQLLARSGAKQLALASLQDRDTSELPRERVELRTRFDAHLPSAAHVEHLGRERDRASQALEETDRRIDRLHELRGQTSVLHFRERGRLDDLLCDAQAAREQHVERCHHTTRAHDLAAERLHDWLGEHGDAAARLVVADRELASRQQLHEVAMARQTAVEPTPRWPERRQPARDRGIGLDR